MTDPQIRSKNRNRGKDSSCSRVFQSPQDNHWKPIFFRTNKPLAGEQPCGDGGQAAAAQINGPQAISIDGVGNIYFSDGNNVRVRMINTAGIISTVAGTGSAGFSGDGGLAVNAEFHLPNSVTFDSSFCNLYITTSLKKLITVVPPYNHLPYNHKLHIITQFYVTNYFIIKNPSL